MNNFFNVLWQFLTFPKIFQNFFRGFSKFVLSFHKMFSFGVFLHAFHRVISEHSNQ